MNDKNFDLYLQNSLPELPPEDIAKKVNPWKKFIYYILIGLILNTQSLPFFYLSYIMPLIGNVFLFLGFQALRKENRFFKIGFFFTCVHFIFITFLKLNVTLLQEHGAVIFFIIVIIFSMCFYGLFRCLALGINEIQAKGGLSTESKSERFVLGCSSALIFLNLLSNKSIGIEIAILVIYILLFWNIYIMMNQIKESGYSIQIAPIFLSTKAVIFVAFLLTLGGFVFGDIFLSPVPENQMEWYISDSSDVKTVKNHMVKLGFPEHILDSLLEKDILACKDAKKVVVTQTQHNTDNQDIPKEYTAYDIAVELDEKDRRFKIFHYFEWNDDARFYGSDCIVLWPVRKGFQNEWDIPSGYTGHILYDIDDLVYRASFDNLYYTNYYNPSSGGSNGDPEIIIEFTYPKNAVNKRGYVSYEAIAKDLSNVTLNSWITYIHQNSRFLFPVETAEKHWTYRYYNEGKNEKQFLMFETSIHYNLKTEKLFYN